MSGISVVIITLNEERNIARCIQSVKGLADEVLVVDSNSTDLTCRKGEEMGARVISHEWLGYTATKNFANSQARFDHILSLDADESLSDTLRESILSVKESWPTEGYTMNRLVNYCGHWIRHCGWYPDRKLRLFDRSKAQWTGDMIHESISMDIDAQVLHLKGDMLHYSYYSLAEHIQQAEKFTDLTSLEAWKAGKKSGSFKLHMAPLGKFVHAFIFQLGFLDGFFGYQVCRLSAHATYLKYNKLRQLNRANQ